MNFYTIRINKLLELDTTISDEERITAVVPMKKYIKDIAGKKEITSEYGQVKKKAGKTLVKGYTNRNNQENYGCLNKPGNHYNQMAYLLHCNECGFEYEANGCDIVPFKEDIKEFMKYKDSSTLLRIMLKDAYEITDSFERVSDLLFVYNFMYNGTSFNIRNELVHGREYIEEDGLRFAFKTTLLSIYMIDFRIRCIREQLKAHKDVEE